MIERNMFWQMSRKRIRLFQTFFMLKTANVFFFVFKFRTRFKHCKTDVNQKQKWTKVYYSDVSRYLLSTYLRHLVPN